MMMPERTICGKRAGFLFFILRNTEVIIFPQAQWKVIVYEILYEIVYEIVYETDSDYVI